jgi:hypothetical protein
MTKIVDLVFGNLGVSKVATLTSIVTTCIDKSFVLKLHSKNTITNFV